MTNSLIRDARSYLAVRVGDEPLVPPEKRGTALQTALAAIERLAAMRRPRSRVLHRKKPAKARSGASYNTDEP